MAQIAPVLIEPLRPDHLPQAQLLVNLHLGALLPGWALPADFIASRLQRDPGEAVVDPWVRERVTLCALVQQRVVAVAHLLRYGTGAEVSDWYRGCGEIAWFLAWPDASKAALALLAAAQRQLTTWQARRAYAWGLGLPVSPFVGVPDVWPHIADALTAAGYHPNPGREEVIYAGALDQIPQPAAAPLPGLTARRTMGGIVGARFSALLDGQEVGCCECGSDLTMGGALPALRGWGELSELQVSEPWRRRGIGTWLVQQAVAWHRLGGGDRMALAVTAEDEAAGAGRFYQRLGWAPLVRERLGWEWSASGAGG